MNGDMKELEFPAGEEFDVVICGTGLKECILSGLLSKEGKKVLHIDRNRYYGGACASLNLTTLWEKFGKGVPPKEYGENRHWNIDLVPKFIMANGKLVSMLVKTRVTHYLSGWESVEGTYVYQYQAAGFFSKESFIHKVPATDSEALKSNLLSLTEKFRCKSFFQFAMNWDPQNSNTWEKFNPNTTTMAQVFSYFSLDKKTIEFIGHAVALYPSDDYLTKPMGPTMDKIMLYFQSISKYGKSPFIYPVYGLQGIPEGFCRLCAVNGGTFMLNKSIDSFVYDDSGKVCGVKATTGEVAKCKQVICDPSYALPMPNAAQKLRKVGQTVRAICILGAPIPSTSGANSCQIIIPQAELKRRTDIYIMVVSAAHNVCINGKYIAIVSATVETENPRSEIEPALKLLGNIENMFVSISDNYEPSTLGTEDGVFISKSYDAESHFESATDDVEDLYQRIMGKALELPAAEVEADE
eukprot:GDKJ01048310.1.p1 GENE.GDKJ01048310.1~~GDKJ01048310.1.p1  ORF type:complete len:468 (-),score=125.91 GDKJ01048310.1:106-1509(-)